MGVGVVVVVGVAFHAAGDLVDDLAGYFAEGGCRGGVGLRHHDGLTGVAACACCAGAATIRSAPRAANPRIFFKNI